MKSLWWLVLVLCIHFPSFSQDSKPKEVVLKSIYFGGGSYEIDFIQIEEIKRLVESFPNLIDYQISITSYTDNIGGKEYNEWLSKMCSEAVLEELLNNKVPREKIFIKDFGQENPHYNNQSYIGRRLNRRVDILFSPLNF